MSIYKFLSFPTETGTDLNGGSPFKANKDASVEEISEALHFSLNRHLIDRNTGEYYTEDCESKAAVVTLVPKEKLPRYIFDFYKRKRNRIFFRVSFRTLTGEEAIYIRNKAVDFGDETGLDWWGRNNHSPIYKKH